ncbi:MAG: phospho-N-acetylmuramoyl-pentapeptide-transferase [Ruminiclostridium sp.]|nr:phospho-N-acetylmuramoyl-pentapeptide-transferase [Ruminiclostridium sp.]
MNIPATVITAVLCFGITALLGFVAIPALKRLKFGQTILDIGPAWHKSKNGTPTMGGVMFIAGVIISFVVGLAIMWASGNINMDEVGSQKLAKAISAVIMALLFGFVGFVDDLIKVKKKQNEGLKPMQKIIMQVLIIAAFFTSHIIAGDTSTVITFPFLGQFDFGIFYYIVMGLGIIYLVNAVNLTDGVDGLCSSVTLVYCAAYVVICSLLGMSEMGLVSAAAGAGCLGFMVWNLHPAKVMMGDTGSMFLGGIVTAVGIGTGTEFVMVVCCAVYIWEALSVLIQMTYFKITHGKRLFKMTPIHHSFEIRGWKEGKIVAVFSLLELLACSVGILLQYFGN